jgi:two-component system cell cycle response regulator
VRILIVEDDIVSQTILTKALDSRGHAVTIANDGAEAVRLIETNDFDVVISDWVMPNMDGVELCREIRYRDNANYIYFIMVTAKTDREARLLALEEGVDDILVKPLDPSELVARLLVAERILRMQGELREKSGQLRSLESVVEMSNRRVNELFKGLPIPCVTINDEGLIMEWNRVAEALYNLKSHEVWMQPLWDVIVSKKHKRQVKELVWAALGTEWTDALDWSFPLKDGREKHMLVSAFPLRAAHGVVVGAAIAFVDITEIKELEEQITSQLMYANELSANLEQKNEQLQSLSQRLEILATTDGLTGLFNRRTFMEYGEVKLAAAQTGHLTAFSVVITDVDKFKTFNDEYGHQVGDEVLRRVASVLKRVTEDTPGAYVARYGGEEFVAALDGRNAASAVEFAERLRLEIESEEWPWRQVTSSFGVATYAEGITKLDELIEQADEALYFSKESGRNRTSHYSQVSKKAA